MNLNEQLRQAYQRGYRQGLNEVPTYGPGVVSPAAKRSGGGTARSTWPGANNPEGIGSKQRDSFKSVNGELIEWDGDNWICLGPPVAEYVCPENGGPCQWYHDGEPSGCHNINIPYCNDPFDNLPPNNPWT